MGIQVLIADDHALIRQGLRLTFASTDVDVVAEAADGEEAIAALRAHDVDVAIVDVEMPKMDGLTFLKSVCDASLAVAVLMYSLHDRADVIRRSQELGAKGFLTKGVENNVLIDAVYAVHAGREVWPAIEGTDLGASRRHELT